ncbi:MAG: hypothetical protein HQL40_19540 [Alphaproteobacteria bacterium]|nr:hypothetical protein [Alphaproteobacteria bacterium]
MHDLGYIFVHNEMDGSEGVHHPEFGAFIAEKMLGSYYGDLVRFHSRTLAKIHGRPISKLCIPDKLAFVMFPKRPYIIMTRLTGELDSYKKDMGLSHVPDEGWFDIATSRALAWAESNIDKDYAHRFKGLFSPAGRARKNLGKVQHLDDPVLEVRVAPELVPISRTVG